jgi:small-conductance mechanosensitive channel
VDDDLFYEEPSGTLVAPGRYSVSLSKRVDGVVTPLVSAREFTVEAEKGEASEEAARKELFEFQQKVARLERAVLSTLASANELNTRIGKIKEAIDATPAMDRKWADAARALEKKNNEILRALRGDVTLARRNENVPVAIVERVETIVNDEGASLQRPPGSDVQAFAIASQEFAAEREKLRTLVEADLKALEQALDTAGAPWTPGR